MRGVTFSKLFRGMMLLVLLLAISNLVVFAQEEPPSNEYSRVETVLLEDGTSVDKTIINGPPTPPPGYELERTPVNLFEPNQPMTDHVLTVPAFDWVFGCSSVSGAMIAGYYDWNGYPNMYTGPANGGVMPPNNSTTYWPTWSDGHDTYPNLPLAASHNGVDGRVTKGSIDDYWIQYGSTANDPYITGGWTQHTWSDAIGDYMKTSQSGYGNSDGSTKFYTYTSNPGQLTCDYMETGGAADDGTVGRRLFYQARGYTVTDCYNQKTDNNSGGFTLAMFRAEIDAGNPVMINLDGHTIVGVGYDDASNTIYIHDTWDYSNHSMTWGTSYAGMDLLSVSIVHLTPPTLSAPTLNAISNADGDGDYLVDWTDVTGAITYTLQVDDNGSFTSPSVVYAGGTSQYSVTGQSTGTYYYRVNAENASVVSSWSNTQSTVVSTTTYKVFVPMVVKNYPLGLPPGDFNKSAPANGATGQSASPTLSWGTSSNATSYEYCIDTNNNNACDASWTSTGTNTSVGLSGLSYSTTYYWQVRAKNTLDTTYANGSSTSYWHFTTSALPSPGAFNKSAPTNGATGQSTSPTLSWGTSSNATSYEYCIDTFNNNACDASWISTGTNTSVGLSGLSASTTYSWQVRANNTSGQTFADGGYSSFWTFTTAGGGGGWVNIMTENFEGTFPGVWDVFDEDGTDNGEYYWGKRNCQAYEGSYSGWAVGGGANGSALSCGSNYPDYAASWMVYGPFSLASAEDAELNFMYWVDSEACCDALIWWASTDGVNFYGEGIGGDTGGWLSYSFDLTDVYTLGDLTGQTQVWIAFVFYSDYSINYTNGAFIDNIVLRQCQSDCSSSAPDLLTSRILPVYKEMHLER